MKLFSSLTNRIFVASALLAVVSIAVGIYHTNKAVTAQAERELLRGLDEARLLIEENRSLRVEHFTREARLIADMPRLKAAIDPGNPELGPRLSPAELAQRAETARRVVEEYQQQLSADLFLVTDPHGTVLVRLPVRTATPPASSLPGVRSALAGREASTFVVYPGGILQMVSVPIWINPDAPDILGTLSIGFSLDAAAADRFRLLTNSEIAFGISRTIQASTLPEGGWATLAPLLDHDGLSDGIRLNGSEYIAMTVALAPDGSEVATAAPVQRTRLDAGSGGAKAIVLRSRTERLSFLRALHTSLLLTALVVVLAATVVSYGIARTVTRPLGTITATMREMAATGDLTRRIPPPANPRWEDEDARLLATTFNTMTASIDKFQREAAQRERLSSLGRLSTVVAHEIRNPLMIIKAALRSLRREEIAPADVQAAVADIDEEIVRLNHIVSEVLDFAKPIKFELERVDVNTLCTDAARAASSDANGGGVRLHLDPALPAVVSDAERLRLALVNVLMNAREAVASAGHENLPDAIRVATARGSDGHVRVQISDRGNGIAADDLPRIFDPFFTTRRTGTGLGLAITRNIIEGLGGSIAVASKEGTGTDVTITLSADGRSG